MLRAAFWALRARMRARHAVFHDGIAQPVRLPAPPSTPIETTRAVVGVLGRTHATCLVRSLVLQRWFAAHGESIDLVIGVTAPSEGFRAHAWLDRAGWRDSDGFVELLRLTAAEALEAGAGAR